MTSDKSYATEARLGTLIGKLGGLALDGAGFLSYAGNDAATYVLGAKAQSNSGAINVQTGFTTIVSQPVSAASYWFLGVCRLKQGAVGNAAGNFGFSGPAITTTVWYYVFNTGFGNWATVGTLSTVNILGATAANVENLGIYLGTVTFSSGGTFALGAIAAVNNGCTAQPGCMFLVGPAS